MLKNRLLVSSLAFVSSLAWGADTAVMEDISVQASPLKIHDEVTYAPHSISIEQPASDVNLGETLSKLPGVLVRSTSGFGSSTTVISSQALGSGGTAVSIDDIPVVESSGRGVNFSLFPSPLIGSVEHYSPFFPSIDPTADTLPSPGGRINLKTLDSPKKGELPWAGGLTLGTAHSIRASAAYRGGTERSDWIAGISGFNTAGDYHFRNPLTGGSENRANNDAAGLGGLAKYRWRLGGESSVELLDFISTADRTNPGPITGPSRQHQRDLFNLFGMRYSGPRLLGERDGIFAKAALGYARTATRGPSGPVGDPGQTTDSRSIGYYTQAGYVRRDERTSFTLGLDNQYDFLRKDEGLFTREVFGATATFSVDVGKFRVVPMARQDAASKFESAGDGALSVIYMPDSDDDLTLSYGLTHMYPSITAVSGFSNGGFTVLPNSDLKVQRDSQVALSFDRKKSWYTLYSSVFYDLVRNRSTYTLISPRPMTVQFVNTPAVSVAGCTLDGQVFPIEPLSLRASVTIVRAWDQASGNDMPYKPRLEGWSAASYLVRPWLGVTLQERFVGKRFVSTDGVETVDPFAETIVRLDAHVWAGVLFFKVENLFDSGAFENPGFPYPGRMFWLGYTLGTAQL